MPVDWNEVKSWVKNTTKIALRETEDLTRKGKLKMEIFTLSSEKNYLLRNLGALLYSEYKKDKEVSLSAKMKEIVDKIQKTEEKINEKRAQLKKEE